MDLLHHVTSLPIGNKHEEVLHPSMLNLLDPLYELGKSLIVSPTLQHPSSFSSGPTALLFDVDILELLSL